MGRVVIPGFRKIEIRGGEGGTSNYNDLTNKPSINNVPLSGNLNTIDLHLTDSTLTKEGVPADAKAVGAKLDEVKKSVDGIEIGGRNLIALKDLKQTDKLGYNDDYTVYSKNKSGGDSRKWEYSNSQHFIDLSAGTYMLTIFVTTITDNSSSGLQIFAENGETITTNSLDCALFDTFKTTGRKRIKITVEEGISIGIMAKIYSAEYKIKLEKGNKATDWTPAIEDTEAEIQAVDNKMTTNLLKPTLETTTQNGVTCTNNGDGTYTLNGKATADTNFNLLNNFDFIGKLKIVGCPSGGSMNTYRVCYTNSVDNVYNDIGDGVIIEHFSSETYPNAKFILFVTNGATLNNIVFKPMITTNLNTTYDDFVPYTGSTGQLNSDVSSLLKRIEALESLVNKTDTTTTE